MSAGRRTPPPAAPGKAEIFAAIPGGSRRCRSQREWLHGALAEVEAQGWYANRAAHYTAICRRLALSMDWRLRTSRLGHEKIAASVGVSPDTVARCVAWLRERGLLGLVSPGTTAELRAGVLYAGTGNLAAVYVLAVPRKRTPLPRPGAGRQRFADLSGSRSDPDKAPRAREARPKVKTITARAPRGLPLLPPARRGQLRACPETRSDGLVAAEALRDQSRELARLSPAMIRHLCRPLFAAGWTQAEVLTAVDYAPGGRQHRYSRDVHHPAGWLRWRLARWLSPDGGPLPSPSQVRAAARERDLEHQAQRPAVRRSGSPNGAALTRARMPTESAPRSAGAAGRRRPRAGPRHDARYAVAPGRIRRVVRRRVVRIQRRRVVCVAERRVAP